MTSRILIKNDEYSPHAVIVHFSNDSATGLLKPGESVDAAIYQGMCISLIESDGLSWLIAQFERAANCVVSPVDMPLEFSQKEGE